MGGREQRVKLRVMKCVGIRQINTKNITEVTDREKKGGGEDEGEEI